VNTAWALGLIVGPALGGYLSQVPTSGCSKEKEMEFLKEKRKKESLVFLLQSPFFPPQPAEKYPHVFSKDSVFGRYQPFLTISVLQIARN
jgi:hypothetical protein